MSDLLIADVSEFQGSVDWNAYVGAGHTAVIIRAHNGYRADQNWSPNRDAFQRAGGRLTGIYQYLVADRDPGDQAAELCDLIGTLRPGEWPILDLEDGDGDQSDRARQWRQVVTSRLGGTTPWLYSGQYYYEDHNLGNAGFDPKNTWIASYRSTRPGSPDFGLWQFSDSYGPMAGIEDAHDCSRYPGTVDDLTDVVGSAGAPKPPLVPFPGADKFGPGAYNGYVTQLGRWLVAKGYGGAYQVGPGPRWGTADQKATRNFQLAQGWTGSDADGIPGPETWRRLQQ